MRINANQYESVHSFRVYEEMRIAKPSHAKNALHSILYCEMINFPSAPAAMK